MLGPKLLKTEVSRFVTLGRNVIANISQIVDDLHLGKVGIIIQGYVDSDINIKSVINNLRTNLENTNRVIHVLELKVFEREELIKYKELIMELKPNFIIIVGEGYCIESVKFLMTILPKHIEWVSIPTSPVHDGFASPFIFLKRKNEGEKYYGISKTPVAIIADTNLIEHASSRSIKSGVGILLSRFSSNWDWKLASRLRSEPISDFIALVSDEIVKLQVNNLEHINSFNPNNPGIAIRELIKGLIITGFLGSFSNNIRASYGSEHMFAQALDDLIPGKTLRGERVAFGTIMMASLQGQDWRLIRSYYKNAGLSVTANELKINSSTIIKALINSVKYPNKSEKYYTILGEKGLTEDAAFRLVYRTGIIGNRPGLN